MLRGGGRDKEEGSPCCAWIWIRSELVLNVLIKSRARAWSLLSLRRRHCLLVKMESAFDPGLIYMMGNSLHPNSFRYTCLIIARHGSEPRNLVQNPTRSFDHLLLFPPPRALCQNKVPFCFLSSFRARARERETATNTVAQTSRIYSDGWQRSPNILFAHVRRTISFMISAPNHARNEAQQIIVAPSMHKGDSEETKIRNF